MVFGKKKEDVSQDKWISILWKNQTVLIGNDKSAWTWIRYLDKQNKAQDAFDNKVIASLEAQKTHSHLELSQQVKDLQKQLAALQSASHTHEEVTVKT